MVKNCTKHQICRKLNLVWRFLVSYRDKPFLALPMFLNLSRNTNSFSCKIVCIRKKKVVTLLSKFCQGVIKSNNDNNNDNNNNNSNNNN